MGAATRSAPFSTLASLECARCGAAQAADLRAQLCACGGPLLARYDLETARRTFTQAQLRSRAPSLWRYHELLPVRDPAQVVSLGEPLTPVISLDQAGRALGLSKLYIKDEGLLPTGSFKARGATVGVSRALELGVSTFAMPTNGNAGSAWASYAARAGMRAHIVMPVQVPEAQRTACVLAGASVYAVNGLINEAGAIVAKAVAAFGWYDASTLKEPYRIEGKKTLGFEIAEQFNWDLPDVIVYPTGGGVGLIGMHKAFAELRSLGLVSARLPRFMAVQATGCAPIVAAWRTGQPVSERWRDARTVAFGINVPKALGDFLILKIVRESRGEAIAVDDASILQHQRMLVGGEGVWASTEGGATLAAANELRRSGAIGADERVLLINTGSGLLEGGAAHGGGIAATIPVLEPDAEITDPAAH